MRALRISGNVLVAMSLLGLIGLGVLTVGPEEEAPIAAVTSHGVTLPWAQVASPRVRSAALAREPVKAREPVNKGSSVLQTALPPEPVRPITRVEIPSIDLSAEVVPADLVPIEGGITWNIPAFKVGHAAGTAGAGQDGNAVLLGHVTSLHSGNVFQDLERVEIGDDVTVYSSSDAAFTYRVVSTEHVPRSDSDVLQPTSVPSVSLITCTGIWLPTIWDYTERLVVRAELSQ